MRRYLFFLAVIILCFGITSDGSAQPGEKLSELQKRWGKGYPVEVDPNRIFYAGGYFFHVEGGIVEEITWFPLMGEDIAAANNALERILDKPNLTINQSHLKKVKTFTMPHPLGPLPNKNTPEIIELNEYETGFVDCDKGILYRVRLFKDKKDKIWMLIATFMGKTTPDKLRETFPSTCPGVLSRDRAVGKSLIYLPRKAAS